MIDFSKYTLSEMQAIVTVLDGLTDEMINFASRGCDDVLHDWHIALDEYNRARKRANVLIAQQAREHEAAEAEKVDRIVQACVAGAPPAEPAGDPPAPPDMFGWVGDALDDLCAAGEVFGND